MVFGVDFTMKASPLPPSPPPPSRFHKITIYHSPEAVGEGRLQHDEGPGTLGFASLGESEGLGRGGSSVRIVDVAGPQLLYLSASQ